MTQDNKLVSSVSHSKIISDTVNLSMSISRKRKGGVHKLSKMYDLKRYMDSADMNFSEDMNEMIPKDTPPYLDNGEHYVERIGRALKNFQTMCTNWS